MLPIIRLIYYRAGDLFRVSNIGRNLWYFLILTVIWAFTKCQITCLMWKYVIIHICYAYLNKRGSELIHLTVPAQHQSLAGPAERRSAILLGRCRSRPRPCPGTSCQPRWRNPSSAIDNWDELPLDLWPVNPAACHVYVESQMDYEVWKKVYFNLANSSLALSLK